MQSIYHSPFKTAVAAAQVLMPLLQLQQGAITSEGKVIDNGIFRPLGGIKSFCSWLARWMRKNSEFWVRMSAIQLCLSTIFWTKEVIRPLWCMQSQSPPVKMTVEISSPLFPHDYLYCLTLPIYKSPVHPSDALLHLEETRQTFTRA